MGFLLDWRKKFSAMSTLRAIELLHEALPQNDILKVNKTPCQVYEKISKLRKNEWVVEKPKSSTEGAAMLPHEVRTLCS